MKSCFETAEGRRQKENSLKLQAISHKQYTAARQPRRGRLPSAFCRLPFTKYIS